MSLRSASAAFSVTRLAMPADAAVSMRSASDALCPTALATCEDR